MAHEFHRNLKTLVQLLGAGGRGARGSWDITREPLLRGKITYIVAPDSQARRLAATMQSHEVMREVLKKTSAKQIAADMGLSLSLIYKWAEPPEDDSGSGASSPLDRVGQLIRITHDARVAQWVCEQAGGFFIRNPHNLPPLQPLIPITNDIVQEFADMLATIAMSSADSVITKEEARNIRQRWEELKTVTEGFVRAAESGNFGAVKDLEKKD